MRSVLLAGATVAVLAVAAPVAAASPEITLFAGFPGESGAAVEGPVAGSHFNEPFAVIFDSHGNAYISDAHNREVEKVTPLGQLSIIAGNGTEGLPTPGEGPNAARSSELGEPEGLAVNESGDLYIDDFHANVVEEVTPAGALSIVAGKSGERGEPTEGPATSSKLNDPSDIALDSGGDLYIDDFNNDVIEKVTPQGQLSIVAGEIGQSGAPTEGPATQSKLGEPVGVAVDRNNGNLYIADDGSHLIEEVTPAGHLSVIAGRQSAPGQPGEVGAPVEGPATSSPMFYPVGVAVDQSGDVYFSETDFANETNCEVDAVTGGQLSVIAGAGPCGPSTYGVPAVQSALDYPYYIGFDNTGALYVPDSVNDTIERIAPVTPTAPAIVSAAPGDGSAVIAFDPPARPGTTLVSGYEVSTDGGAHWHAITTTAGSAGALDTTLSGLTNGSTYTVLVRAVNAGGAGEASAPVSVTPRATAVAAAAARAQCRSERTERIHWKLSGGVRLQRIVVRVNGRVYRRLSGAARQVSVSLKGRGTGRVNVTVIGTTRSGARYESGRSFHPCTPARPANAPVSGYLRRAR